MAIRTLAINPFELPGGANPETIVTISLVDENNQRIQGLVTSDGQPIIDLFEAVVTNTTVYVDLWPQPDLAAVLGYGSDADASRSYYLTRVRNQATRFNHVFRTQVATGGPLGWAEFASGVVPPLEGGQIETISHGELEGLDDDDHLQYHTNVRGDARYTLIPDFDAHAGNLPQVAHVPAGGTAGKFLGKVGPSDWDVGWLDVGVNTIGEFVPGAGNVWDDVNAHCFDGLDSDGECRLPIGPNDIAYIGHDGVVYRYFGPQSVCIGSGGAGGQYDHYTVQSGDLVATGSTDHTALSNRDATDSHPQTAITDLVSDQAAQDARLDTSEAHAADISNPHNVTAVQAGADPVGSAAVVQTNLDTHEARYDNPHSVTRQQLGALGAVEDDPTPVLGGKLKTEGNAIALTNDDDTPFGQLFSGVGIEGDYVALAKTDVDGNFDFNDGAIALLYGQVQLLGGAVKIDSFAQFGAGNRQVYVNDQGQLYTVIPPDPGWSVSDTDTGDYDLGTGTSPQPWIEMSGLAVVLPQDVVAGNRIDVYANVNVVNKTGNRSGNIEIGFGVDGAAPSSGSNVSVPPGFDGYAPVNISTITHGGLTAGEIVSVFARIISGSHGQFGVDLIGTLGDPHELVVSVPAGQ